MDYQGRYDNKTVASFLINDVHPAMDAKYFIKISPDKKDANQLQQFFQELKIAAKSHKDQNIISNLVLDNILYTLQQMKRQEQWNYNISNLFQRSGGITFEKEISDVILAIAANLTDEDLNIPELRKNINIGGVKGNVIDEDFSSSLSQYLLKATGVKMEKKIINDAGEAQKLHYLANVEGKADIDATNFEISIKLNPDNYLLNIWKILSQAVFSAKNYDSLTWDEKIKTLVDAHHDKIKIGDSNIIRSLYGSLNSLGLWDHKTIISAIYAGYWATTKYNQQPVMTHFYHLRYIYELTGAGIMYNGKMANEVRFLIYNDPHGDIYVKSTAEIIGEVLNNQPAFRGNPFKDIYIKKSYFHE